MGTSFYYGTWYDRSGVAIAVAEKFRDVISLVEQISGQLVTVTFHASNKAMCVAAAYAPTS